MATSVVYKISDPKFTEIVQGSSNVSQVLEKLGGGSAQTAKKRIKELGLELGKKNSSISKPKQQLREKSKRQQVRVSESRYGRSAMWSEGFPWPVVITLGGVGLVALFINQLSRSDAEGAQAKRGPTIEDIKDWVSQVEAKNDERYQQTKDAIGELEKGDERLIQTADLVQKNKEAISRLEEKKIPSLKQTREILSDITTKSNEFQTIYNQAQLDLNKTEARIEQLKEQTKKVVDEARKVVSPRPSTAARIQWGVGGGLGGAIIIAGLMQLLDPRWQEPRLLPITFGAVVGGYVGASGVGWPVFKN